MTPDVKVVDLVRPLLPSAMCLKCVALHARTHSQEVPDDWAYMIGSDGIFDALSDQAELDKATVDWFDLKF